MSKRPFSITVIGWIFIISCAAGLIYHSLPNSNHATVQNGTEVVVVHVPDAAMILGIRVLGLIGGVFVLKGKNWARWVLLVWMGAHVGISVMHSWGQVAVHAVFFVVLACFLFSPKAGAFFKSAS